MRMHSKPVASIPFWKEDYSSYIPADLPFYVARHFRDPFPLFSHVYIGFELAAVLSGTGSVFCAGKSYPVKGGDCYFFDGQIPHGIGASTRMDIILAVVQTDALLSIFPKAGDVRVLDPFFAIRHGIPPMLRASRRINAALRDAFDTMQSNSPGKDLAAWNSIAHAFIGLSIAVSSEKRDAKTPPAEHWSAVQPAIRHLQEHACDDIRLRDLAKLCNLSISRFSFLFGQVMNTSPMEYRNQLRIHAAAESIVQTNDKIPGIAYDCGFSSYSNFCERFQAIMGCSPAAWRNRKRE